MKRHFITGLIILLPLALTVLVISFIFNLLTTPFLGISESIFSYFNLFTHGFWIFSAEQIRAFVAKLTIVLVLFLFTIGLGAVARWFLFRSLLRFWDFILHRIPLVNTIYKTCQDVISTLFSSKADSFKDVVLVPFPHANSQTIGLVTRTGVPSLHKDYTGNLVVVFIPTAPNPTSGFVVLFPEGDLTYINIKVEEALKYVVSCGVLPTPIMPMTKIQEATSTTPVTEKP
jgi:uncharacterized membrane protein